MSKAITVVHLRSDSGDHYLNSFQGEVDTDSEEFWNEVSVIHGDETEFLEVVDEFVVRKKDFK